MESFKTIYEKNLKEGQVGVYIIEQFGVHDPYSWRQDINNLPYSSADHLNELVHRFSYTNYSLDERHKVYANATYGIDIQFKQLINYLKKCGAYEKTTLILVSDHGESLGEKKTTALTRAHHSSRVYMHGASLNQEEIDSVYAIKFNYESSIDYQNLQQQNISGVDLFPTIMDGLGYYLDDAKVFFRGGSVLQGTHQSEHVSVLPNWVSPTRRLCLTSNKYKAHLLIDTKDFYEADKFKLIGINTLDDKPIDEIHEREIVINNFEAIFYKGINHIFPAE